MFGIGFRVWVQGFGSRFGCMVQAFGSRYWFHIVLGLGCGFWFEFGSDFYARVKGMG